jgi:hypothetical protein
LWLERAGCVALGTGRAVIDAIAGLELERGVAALAAGGGRLTKVFEQAFWNVDDGVQWRPKLVGHAGQELSLGLRGGFGLHERATELSDIGGELAVQDLQLGAHDVDAVCQSERQQRHFQCGAELEAPLRDERARQHAQRSQQVDEQANQQQEPGCHVEIRCAVAFRYGHGRRDHPEYDDVHTPDHQHSNRGGVVEYERGDTNKERDRDAELRVAVESGKPVLRGQELALEQQAEPERGADAQRERSAVPPHLRRPQELEPQTVERELKTDVAEDVADVIEIRSLPDRDEDEQIVRSHDQHQAVEDPLRRLIPDQVFEERVFRPGT